MRIDIITVLPELLKSPFEASILKRAIVADLVEVHFHNLRDYTTDNYKTIDDYQFGGGAGMVMQVKPIRDCLSKIKKNSPNTKVIYLSPQGRKLNQELVEELSELDSITFLCGRYEGVDERVIENDVDMEVSIGDYVISGGELAAMVLIDAISRRLPGVLGNESSLKDSFTNNLLDHPHYTRPEIVEGQSVPEVLLSGHQAKIDAWRLQQSIEKTKLKRPDLMND